MSRPKSESDIREKIANDIQSLIDDADESVSDEFIAGLETALAIASGSMKGLKYA